MSDNLSDLCFAFRLQELLWGDLGIRMQNALNVSERNAGPWVLSTETQTKKSVTNWQAIYAMAC